MPPHPPPDPGQPRLVAIEYATAGPLTTRIRTHELYTRPRVDFPAWVLNRWRWTGREAVLDLGCGAGYYLKATAARTAGPHFAADLSPGMLCHLAATGGAVPLLVADAQAIPFPEGAFDVVLANHMLFHVPDLPRAVAEIARVLRPGGGLLAATNSSAYMPELRALLRQAAARLGRPAMNMDYSVVQSFSLENGAVSLAGSFGQVESVPLDTALVFPEPMPCIEFADSLETFHTPHLPPDLTWTDLIAAARDLLHEHFTDHTEFRVSKRAGVFVARRPRHPDHSSH